MCSLEALTFRLDERRNCVNATSYCSLYSNFRELNSTDWTDSMTTEQISNDVLADQLLEQQ